LVSRYSTGGIEDMKPYVIQPEDVETLPGTNPMNLLADADVTDGAVSISSGRIVAGADNARPHFHQRSWEIFAILTGRLQLLLDDEVVTVGGGGLVAVPPGVVHAFGATPEEDVEAIVFVTPGVQRFDYFRLLPRILAGEIPPAELEEMHRTYDVHFVQSELWETTRRRLARR
jgi:mannose-6-phosphate isomerase-like protein (cupin superfamily)